MSLSLLGTRDPATVAPGATIAEAVRLMAARDVGSVVVVEDDVPVGILTDRDVVLRVVDRGAEPDKVTVRVIMSRDLVTALDTCDIDEAAWKMREHAVRRLPITTEEGTLLGIVTLDDLVGHIGSTRDDVAEIIASFFAPYQAV